MHASAEIQDTLQAYLGEIGAVRSQGRRCGRVSAQARVFAGHTAALRRDIETCLFAGLPALDFVVVAIQIHNLLDIVVG
jgi:hypothetical protein